MSTTVDLTVDYRLAPLIKEILHLWERGEHTAIINGLNQLITELQINDPKTEFLGNKDLLTPEGQPDDYVKSWQEILNVEMYVDTQIYGDRELPVVTPNTLIQHAEGTETYLQSWAEVAKEMQNLPDNLFTKLWKTVEIAEILDCSPATLRRARQEKQLPLKIKGFVLDCVPHDEKHSLWFVRPA
jgi:hypothetical protein